MERDERFEGWLTARINRPSGEPTWQRVLSNEFEFAVAGARLLVASDIPLADDIELGDGLRQPPTVDDRLAILRTWCLSPTASWLRCSTSCAPNDPPSVTGSGRS